MNQFHFNWTLKLQLSPNKSQLRNFIYFRETYIFIVCVQILDTGCMSVQELGVYLDGMEQDGTWGDGIMLSTAARLYRRPMTIISSDKNVKLIDTAVPSASPEGSEPLRLGLVNNNHYVSIMKDSESTPQDSTATAASLIVVILTGASLSAMSRRTS